MNRMIVITDRKGADHFIGSAFIVSIVVNPNGHTIVTYQRGPGVVTVATKEKPAALAARING